MSELGKRTISGVILAGLLLIDLWAGSWWYLALLLLLGLIVFGEYRALVLRFASGAAVPVWLIAGAVYVGLAVLGLWRVRSEAGFEWAAVMFAVVWATDVGAFVFGRMIGGPRIAPSISPSKTWAGLAGGMVCAALVMGVALMAWLPFSATLSPLVAAIAGIMLGVPLAAVAQAGDFFESWLKRRAGVKDSGSIIPGHGGLFDRVDGLITVAIVFPWLGLLQ